MGRKPCCPKEGLNRGAWTAMEDDILVSYINKHGEGKWGSLPKRAGLKRCGKSCRLRWLNYLRPGIKRGNISEDEEELIIRLHSLLGNRWSLIAGRLPGRTDNEIKNYWNTTLSKKGLKNSSIRSSREDAAAGASSKRRAAEPAGTASDAAPEASSASPVRTKALRCTTRLPVAQPAGDGRAAPETAAGGNHVRAEQTAVEPELTPAPAEGQQELQDLPEDYSPIDLDFDMEDLGFLSPWRGEACGPVADGVGPGGQFGGDEVDLEALLLGPAGDDDHPSLKGLEFAWF